ncbi:glycosyltransferase family 4 protein [Haloarchaeobius sp. DYHT-AS-18]|uniref:glycosyltransferase family 4 protein n=1 Tax=Haloarchaeobius sp. DYHT-AS-18 TaxID=3446117 RepID=UPI003EBA633A
MKIVLINPAKQIRKEIKQLSTIFSEEEYQVTVLSPSEPTTIIQGKNVSHKRVHTWEVPGVRYTIPSPSMVANIFKEVRGSDAVIAASHIYLPSFISILIASLFGKRSITIVDALPGISWTYGSTIVDIIAKIYMLTIGSFTLSMSDSVVCLGSYLLDDLSRFVPRDKVHVVPNGVDVDEYPIPESNDTDEYINLLYVGRLDPVKNISSLIYGVKYLSEEYNVYLDIVGDGTQYSYFKSKADSMGIGDIVTFHGWQKDVNKYYNKADVFVLSSLSEGLPSVVLEAQASGVPVVSTDVGGVSEMIGSGTLIEESKPENIKRGIARLIESGTLAPQPKARNHIKQNFSIEDMSDRYKELVELGIEHSD